MLILVIHHVTGDSVVAKWTCHLLFYMAPVGERPYQVVALVPLLCQNYNTSLIFLYSFMGLEFYI